MKQLPFTYKTLGGETVTIGAETATERGKHYVAPRGYAAPPGTGPGGETCGSCKNHVVRQFAKNYHKCILMQAKWTGGGGSDIRVRSPACQKWEKSS